MTRTTAPSGMATLHLHSVHGVGIVRAAGRMAFDRRHLSSTPGLRFWKLLGTGHGRSFTTRDANLRRWGFFGVWDSIETQQAFTHTSPVATKWRSIADETWHADLVPLRWTGRWSRRDPFDGFEPSANRGDGRIAVLTRARVHAARWRAFSRTVPSVAAAVGTATGRTLAIGIGEAPIGLQATFSLWQDAPSMEAFAYGQASHLDVVRRTRAEGWYAEEMFARFAVLATTGTIDGRPL